MSGLTNDKVSATATIAFAHRPTESRPERHRLRRGANVDFFILELVDELFDDPGADAVAAATQVFAYLEVPDHQGKCRGVLQMAGEPAGEEHACDLFAPPDVGAPLVLGRPEVRIPPPPRRVEPVVIGKEWTPPITQRCHPWFRPHDLAIHGLSLPDSAPRS